MSSPMKNNIRSTGCHKQEQNLLDRPLQPKLNDITLPPGIRSSPLPFADDSVYASNIINEQQSCSRNDAMQFLHNSPYQKHYQSEPGPSRSIDHITNNCMFKNDKSTFDSVNGSSYYYSNCCIKPRMKSDCYTEIPSTKHSASSISECSFRSNVALPNMEESSSVSPSACPIVLAANHTTVNNECINEAIRQVRNERFDEFFEMIARTCPDAEDPEAVLNLAEVPPMDPVQHRGTSFRGCFQQIRRRPSDVFEELISDLQEPPKKRTRLLDEEVETKGK